MHKEIPLTGITSEEWWKRRASLSIREHGFRSVMSLSHTPEQSIEHTIRSKEVFFSVLDPYLKKTDHLLEIGTGIGRFTDDLARRVQKVTTFDYSGAMLDVAKTNISSPLVDQLQANALYLPFENNSADVFFEMTVFMHIVDDQPFLKAIQEAKRVVRNDGIIFLCSHLSSDEQRHQEHFLLIHRPVRDYFEALSPLSFLEKVDYDGRYTMVVVKNSK